MEDVTSNEEKILEKIQEALENEELISNPELSLYDFAKAINSPARIVSNAINKRFKKGFRALLNPYRVKKAVKMIKSKDKRRLNEIGRAAGFNSRTTFFTSFKHEIGLSPREFAKLVEEGHYA